MATDPGGLESISVFKPKPFYATRLDSDLKPGNMRATLIVISRCVHLAELETVLGKSRFEHSLGASRGNGIVRKQSIWMRDWLVSAEPPASPLAEVLAWYGSKRCDLLALDPDVFVKLSAVSDGDGFAVPIELAEQLFLQRVHLLVTYPEQAVDQA